MSKTEENKRYNERHRAERAEKRKIKAETDPHYVAGKRIRRYRQADLKYGRGECTLTKEYLVDDIWKRGCAYCGTYDWHILGVDRIDNSKPHTPDNIVCSCKRCNELRQRRDFLDYFYERYMDSILE